MSDVHMYHDDKMTMLEFLLLLSKSRSEFRTINQFILELPGVCVGSNYLPAFFTSGGVGEAALRMVVAFRLGTASVALFVFTVVV